MENAIKSRLQSVQFGEIQQYKNIAILPVIVPPDGAFQYRPLGDALATWDVAISETSASGSVPELLVINRCNKPILLIDGEELAGAKQNRVLNTSILLKEISETKIPVSCTEQGRWSYSSKSFQESGNVMAYRSRSKKTSSVHYSLEASGAHKSDQAAVWNCLAELQAKASAPSPTSAMSDVFKAREEDLRKCADVFQCLAGQVGLLAFIDGKPAGMDLVSLNSAYAKLHPKLVRSYALEGLIESRPQNPEANGFSAKATDFLAQIAAAQETYFPSIGYGTDFRYRSVTPHSAFRTPHLLAGTALVHENEVIHAAFFRLDETEQPDRIATAVTQSESCRSRRQYEYP